MWARAVACHNAPERSSESHKAATMTALAWGILGPGRIAGTFAGQLASSDAGKCVAVGSRRKATAEAFGDKYGVARRYGSYEEFLGDAEVDVVYVATPHPFHAEWAI